MKLNTLTVYSTVINHMYSQIPQCALVDKLPAYTPREAEEDGLLQRIRSTFGDMGLEEEAEVVMVEVKNRPDLYVDDKRPCVQALALYHHSKESVSETQRLEGEVIRLQDQVSDLTEKLNEASGRFSDLERMVTILKSIVLKKENCYPESPHIIIHQLLVGDTTFYDKLRAVNIYDDVDNSLLRGYQLGMTMFTYLTAAIISRKPEAVKRVLVKTVTGIMKHDEADRRLKILFWEDKKFTSRPLYLAASLGYVEIVVLLLEYGAPVNIGRGNICEYAIPDTLEGSSIHDLLLEAEPAVLVGRVSISTPTVMFTD